MTLDRPNLQILVEYLEGPVQSYGKPLDLPARPARAACEVEFFISYEFNSRMLGLLMGSMFDLAFRQFAVAFERRADVLHAQKTAYTPSNWRRAAVATRAAAR